MKINQKQWKSINSNGNQSKTMEINQYQWKSINNLIAMKISAHSLGKRRGEGEGRRIKVDKEETPATRNRKGEWRIRLAEDKTRLPEDKTSRG